MTIRIYLFKCNHCGLLYFGKTERKNWKTYKGSGKYWKAHLKKYKPTITKKWIGYFINKESAKTFCLWYSRIKNIVKSDLYANLIEENGLDGACKGHTFNKGKKHTEEHKKKLSKIMTGKKHTKETKLKLSKIMKEKTYKKTKEYRKNMSDIKKGKKLGPQQKVICPHCNKKGGITNMKRYHFNKCKNRKLLT